MKDRVWWSMATTAGPFSATTFWMASSLPCSMYAKFCSTAATSSVLKRQDLSCVRHYTCTLKYIVHMKLTIYTLYAIAIYGYTQKDKAG